MTLSAKSSLFLGENKAGFRRESHFNGASYSSQNNRVFSRLAASRGVPTLRPKLSMPFDGMCFN